jgi:hypothetical protein
MPAKRKAASPKDASTATIGFEAKLWLAADSRSPAMTAKGDRSSNLEGLGDE